MTKVICTNYILSDRADLTREHATSICQSQTYRNTSICVADIVFVATEDAPPRFTWHDDDNGTGFVWSPEERRQLRPLHSSNFVPTCRAQCDDVKVAEQTSLVAQSMNREDTKSEVTVQKGLIMISFPSKMTIDVKIRFD